MKLELITVLGQKMNEDVYEVVVPTADGSISVYPMHQPLITVVVPGVLTVRRNRNDLDSQLEFYATSGGVAEIDNKRIRILVDEAEHADDITEAEAKAAYEAAQEMKVKAGEQVDLERAQQMMDRHALRLKVAEVKRRRYKG